MRFARFFLLAMAFAPLGACVDVPPPPPPLPPPPLAPGGRVLPRPEVRRRRRVRRSVLAWRRTGPRRSRTPRCAADHAALEAAAARRLRRQARNLRLVATGGLRLRMVEPCTCGVRHEAEFEHAPASLPPGFAFEVRG